MTLLKAPRWLIALGLVQARTAVTIADGAQASPGDLIICTHNDHATEAGNPDVRGMPDGLLLHLRDTYPIETAWAPQWVGDELRQVRPMEGMLFTVAKAWARSA
jgi:hypothetical protein